MYFVALGYPGYWIFEFIYIYNSLLIETHQI